MQYGRGQGGVASRSDGSTDPLPEVLDPLEDFNGEGDRVKHDSISSVGSADEPGAEAAGAASRPQSHAASVPSASASPNEYSTVAPGHPEWDWEE